MKLLSIDFENCFGIGKLNCQFDFTQTNSHLIYAPNGTMKTSFANTFDLIAKNDNKNQPKDLIHKKNSKFKIFCDNNYEILTLNRKNNRELIKKDVYYRRPYYEVIID